MRSLPRWPVLIPPAVETRSSVKRSLDYFIFTRPVGANTCFRSADYWAPTGLLLGGSRGGTEKPERDTSEWLLRFPDPTACGHIER